MFNELLQKASFEPNGKMRCLFGIAKRFLKLLWICCKRLVQGTVFDSNCVEMGVEAVEVD